MNARLDIALQDCLQSIEAGAAVDEALARHSDLRSDLEPLLASALTLRHLPMQRLHQRDRVAMCDTVLDQITVDEAAAARMPGKAVAGLAAGFFVVLATVVFASANSVPGDRLYPLMRAATRVWQVGAQGEAGPVAPGDAEPVVGRGRGRTPDRQVGDAATLDPRATTVARMGGARSQLVRTPPPTPGPTIPSGPSPAEVVVIVVTRAAPPAADAAVAGLSPGEHANPLPSRVHGTVDSKRAPKRGATATAEPSPTAVPSGVVGWVRDLDGAGIAGALVMAEPVRGEGGAFELTRADGTGFFVLDLPPGEHWLWAEADGFDGRWYPGAATRDGAQAVVILAEVGRVQIVITLQSRLTPVPAVPTAETAPSPTLRR